MQLKSGRTFFTSSFVDLTLTLASCIYLVLLSRKISHSSFRNPLCMVRQILICEVVMFGSVYGIKKSLHTHLLNYPGLRLALTHLVNSIPTFAPVLALSIGSFFASSFMLTLIIINGEFRVNQIILEINFVR